MSYNISGEECLVLDAWMEAGVIRQLLATFRDELPENNFLTELEKDLPPIPVLTAEFDQAIKELRKHDANKADELSGVLSLQTPVPLKSFMWSGEGSGRSSDILFQKIVPHIHGVIEVAFIWEGGDSTTGHRIQDGQVTEMGVKYKLVPLQKTPKSR